MGEATSDKRTFNGSTTYKEKLGVPFTELTYRTIGNFPTKIQFISDFAKLASFVRTPLGFFLFFR